MTREDARRILDRARDGADVPEHLITRALQASGDLEDDGLALVYRRPAGTWERRACRGFLAPATWCDPVH